MNGSAYDIQLPSNPERPGWYKQAACNGMNPGVFFPDPDDYPRKTHGQEYRDAVAAAIAVCQACPVREECLNMAVRDGIKDGIWGGMSPYQRRSTKKVPTYKDTCAHCYGVFTVERSTKGGQRPYYCSEECSHQAKIEQVRAYNDRTKDRRAELYAKGEWGWRKDGSR